MQVVHLSGNAQAFRSMCALGLILEAFSKSEELETCREVLAGLHYLDLEFYWPNSLETHLKVASKLLACAN